MVFHVKRSCGECAACCTADPVNSDPTFDQIAVHKPSGLRCPYQTPGSSPARGCCSVYEQRPRCCAIYECEWLNGHGTEEDRPDRSGVIVEAAREGHRDGRVRIAMLMPAPGFTEASPGFVAAVRYWRDHGAIVSTPSGFAELTAEQVEFLRTVEMRMADGTVMSFE